MTMFIQYRAETMLQSAKWLGALDQTFVVEHRSLYSGNELARNSQKTFTSCTPTRTTSYRTISFSCCHLRDFSFTHTHTHTDKYMECVEAYVVHYVHIYEKTNQNAVHNEVSPQRRSISHHVSLSTSIT